MAKSNSRRKKPVQVQDIFVSAVIVARTDNKKLVKYITNLTEILKSHYTNYEIIVVDNGVAEKSVITLTKMLLNVPCIRIIRLTQQFKHDTALFAGLQVSIGDYVVTLDPTIDPAPVVPKLVKKNQEKDVIQGVSQVPVSESWVGQSGRRLFYWYSRKYIGIDIPINATYLASYSRRAVNAITQSNRSQHHMRHLARRVGYAYEIVHYSPIQSPGRNRKIKHGAIEALEIAISYSTHPLRFVTWLGLTAGVVNVLYAAYVVTLNLLNQQVAAGWTTTSLQLSLMFFILFTIVVIISEYIGRILTESYKDPQYYVSDELTSAVSLADTTKRNVTN